MERVVKTKKKIIRILVIIDSKNGMMAIEMFMAAFVNPILEVTFETRELKSSYDYRTYYDIIFVAVLSPVDAIKIINRLDNISEGLPIISFSQDGNHTLAIDSIKSGAQDFLTVEQLFNEDFLVRSISYAIERKRLLQQINHYAIHDELTGLYNRWMFMEYVQSSVNQVLRYSGDLSFCICDVDSLKKVNSRYGHINGDRALVAVASTLRKQLRESDMVCRFGGDEFCILFTNTSVIDATCFIRRLLKKKMFFTCHKTGEKVKVTTSYGLVQFNNQMKTVSDFIDAADQALYKAKGTGKSLGIMFDGPRLRLLG